MNNYSRPVRLEKIYIILLNSQNYIILWLFYSFDKLKQPNSIGEDQIDIEADNTREMDASQDISKYMVIWFFGALFYWMQKRTFAIFIVIIIEFLSFLSFIYYWFRLFFWYNFVSFLINLLPVIISTRIGVFPLTFIY